MKRFFFFLAVILPLFSFIHTGMSHAQEKRLGQKFIDAFYADDENMMQLLIKENKDAVPQEVEGMLAYAVGEKVDWMVTVCEKMATIYKAETGDDSLLKSVAKAKNAVFGEENVKLMKLKDEVTSIGKGQWDVTTMDYNDHSLKMDINVSPEIGMDIDKKDVEKVGETIEKLLPEALGSVTWYSLGIGVASLLRDEASGPWKTRQ